MVLTSAASFIHWSRNIHICSEKPEWFYKNTLSQKKTISALNAGLLLGQLVRRWPTIEPALAQCPVMLGDACHHLVICAAGELVTHVIQSPHGKLTRCPSFSFFPLHLNTYVLSYGHYIYFFQFFLCRDRLHLTSIHRFIIIPPLGIFMILELNCFIRGGFLLMWFSV